MAKMTARQQRATIGTAKIVFLITIRIIVSQMNSVALKR
jgi:hypothetical protein